MSQIRLGSEMTEVTEAYDFRGRTLIDRDGDKIGKLDDVYTDQQDGQPEWALVSTGLFGVVSKERVRLGTEEQTEQETISETLRKERIETDGDARS
jgi:uncharacterized protein YrrD